MGSNWKSFHNDRENIKSNLIKNAYPPFLIETCLNTCTLPQHALTHITLCFKIIDKANFKFDLKIKEAFHISWRKPNLNAQQNHLALTLSL